MADAFPTIQATITLLMQPANVADVNTLWLRQASGPAVLLANAVPDGTATSFVFQEPAPQSIVGKSILIDNEPLKVTALSTDGLTATVERYTVAFPFLGSLPVQPTVAHAAGAGVFVLVYADPWTYIAQRYLLPAFQADVLALGPAAMTFGTVASGTLSAS
jgi:hypothetical protein